MLSRVAEALYWSARYIERAENLARCIDVNLQLMLDAPTQQRRGWESLVMTTGDQEWFTSHYGNPVQDSVIHFLAFDAEYPNSILASITKARENARTVREVISREMWQELNEFYLMVVHAAHPKVTTEELSEFCDRVKRMGIYFEGVTSATLSRGEAWHFAQLGRMLERADQTSRILDVKYFLLLPPGNGVGSTFDQLGWTTLLNSASAVQMYRQHHHVTTPANVAKFLLLDRNFPRSIQHCIVEAQKCVHALTGSPIGTYRNDAERFIGQLRANLDYAEIEQIMNSGLHEYVDVIQMGCNNLGTAIQKVFFQI